MSLKLQDLVFVFVHCLFQLKFIFWCLLSQFFFEISDLNRVSSYFVTICFNLLDVALNILEFSLGFTVRWWWWRGWRWWWWPFLVLLLLFFINLNFLFFLNLNFLFFLFCLNLLNNSFHFLLYHTWLFNFFVHNLLYLFYLYLLRLVFFQLLY